MNIDDLFEEKYEYFLNSINYNMINDENQTESPVISCHDSIEVDFLECNRIKLIFTRYLDCEPHNLFDLSVSFGAYLKFKDMDINDIPDKKTLTNEFLTKESVILNSMIGRSSLQISQITSSFGQAPIITPPIFLCDKNS